MKTFSGLIGSLALACSLGAFAQTQADAPVPGTDGLITSPQAQLAERDFIAGLSGLSETPPRQSQARGAAALRLTPDGQGLRYRLLVRNIENVSAAHLQLGLPGENGPIIVPLLGQGAPGEAANPPSGPADGVIAEGEFSAADLTGPLAGTPLAVFMTLVRSGAVYANVYTSQFPDGELRGTLRGLAVGPDEVRELLQLGEDGIVIGEIDAGAAPPSGLQIGATDENRPLLGGTPGSPASSIDTVENIGSGGPVDTTEGIGVIEPVGTVEGVGAVEPVGTVEGVSVDDPVGTVEGVGTVPAVDPGDTAAALDEAARPPKRNRAGSGSAGGTGAEQAPRAPSGLIVR